jgi:hypothetical protein
MSESSQFMAVKSGSTAKVEDVPRSRVASAGIHHFQQPGDVLSDHIKAATGHMVGLVEVDSH